MRTMHRCFTVFLFFAFATVPGFSQNSDDEIKGGLPNAHVRSAHIAPRGHTNGEAHARFGIFGIDSLANFNGQFFADGVDSNGNPNRHWYTNTVGNPPQLGGTTTINAPVVPVSLDLLDFDGTVRFHYDVTPFIQKTLDSPVFQNSTYSSSPVPTQFTDAVQRAEYFKEAKSDWHTLLAPSLKAARTMRIPRGKYQFSLLPGGVCCRFVLVDIDTFANLLFPAVATDTTTPIGAAENAGDITTKDMSTFLFPNTFLMFDNNPAECCVLGFHSYDFEPGDAGNGFAERRYVVNYSSWISPGLFGAGFTDVTANSHEIAESFNDPFVASDGIHNVTPWWISDNGQCQNILEDGDVVEGLPNATYPVTLNTGGNPFTYHPQNEALLQWFRFETKSSAIGGAYSYPNTTVLTAPSAPQKVNCAP
jgi:hypothetical protein